ncbi:MAG: AarF/ABC1/UbiB kinase family protein [Paracoccaceae bacterium]
MAYPKYQAKGLPVPSGRISRLARFGGLTASVAGSMAFNGGRQLASGQRPNMNDLLLTPANAARFTQQLAQMRGAAMKIGQLMSMEASDFLPPEMADVLAHLRADAHYMPPRQLKKVLIANWGSDFLRRFEKFDVHPIAAASIGQVHRATTRDGRSLAIKVQYPGVRKSIDSDVSNVATLLRLSGLLPEGLDIAPYLEEAKRQLHEEADYEREGQCLADFAKHLKDAPEFIVPKLHADLTTRDLLAMSFVDGVAIETLCDAPQEERDRVMTLLIGLVLRELFEFRLMQTDPNFANYRYDPESGRIILLDFGATRRFDRDLVRNYREILRAGLSGDQDAAHAAAMALGFLEDDTLPRHREALLDMFELAMAPLRTPGIFDFGTNALVTRLRDAGMKLGTDPDFATIPPIDTLYLQRKIGGVYLLASRLRARVDVAGLFAKYI